jgi:hypothetical protein
MRARLIYEKFTEDSDPIFDMGIGLKHKIDAWINENITIQHNPDQYKKPLYTINKKDGTINVYGNLYSLNNSVTKFPEYIKFNIVYGYVDIAYCNLTTLKGFPKIIYGYFRCSNNKLKSLKYFPQKVFKGSRQRSGNVYPGSNPKIFKEEDVMKYCKYIEGRIIFD